MLADLARHPAVRLRIDTVDEVHARARGRAAPAPVDIEATALPPRLGPQVIGAHEDVRQYFLKSGVPTRQADDEVVRLANRVMQQVNRMRVHAWALRTLLEQVPAAEVSRLDARARQQWRALVGEHGREFAREAGAVRALLAPVFPAPSAPDAVPASLEDDIRIREASTRFIEAAAIVDQLLDGAFTLPIVADHAPAASLDAARFWRAFTQATTLAASLERVTLAPTHSHQP